MKNKKTFDQYLEEFKVMLVRRYQWSVTKASLFKSEELKDCFKNGLDKYQAYFKIFNVKQDLVGEIIT